MKHIAMQGCFVLRERIRIVNSFTMVCVFSEGKRLVQYMLQRSGSEWVNPPGGAVKVWLEDAREALGNG